MVARERSSHMDAKGAALATGSECVDWCGHIPGTGFSIAGNMLAGARVLDDTAKAYTSSEHLPFAQRLIAALRAGEAAGGDKRGRQSAALLIHAEEEWSALDLRVDAMPIIWPLERWRRSARRWVNFAIRPTRKNRRRDRSRPRRGGRAGIAAQKDRVRDRDRDACLPRRRWSHQPPSQAI